MFRKLKQSLTPVAGKSTSSLPPTYLLLGFSHRRSPTLHTIATVTITKLRLKILPCAYKSGMCFTQAAWVVTVHLNVSTLELTPAHLRSSMDGGPPSASYYINQLLWC